MKNFLFLILILSGFVIMGYSKDNNSLNSKFSSQKIKDITTSTKTVVEVSEVKSDNNTENGDERVIIDSGFSLIGEDTTDDEKVTPKKENLDALPYNYGQFKGVLNIDGKNMLVFEGDDGTIYFIQIYLEKDKIKWKLYGKIERSYY